MAQMASDQLYCSWLPSSGHVITSDFHPASSDVI